MALLHRRLCDLGLRIEGSALEPVLAELSGELHRAGVAVRPDAYLSTEWGVPEGSTSVAMPFYLARPELVALHRARTGLVEGACPADILRYLRHEMGHVLDYAYGLSCSKSFWRSFGDPGKRYEEEYRPRPFSPEHVNHLPGFYAQKHPVEDWAETFAVWLTPGVNWRREYGDCDGALCKLRFCEKLVASLPRRRAPRILRDHDEDIGSLTCTLEEFYECFEQLPPGAPPAGMAAALRAAFAPIAVADEKSARGRSLAALIAEASPDLSAVIFRMTGHFPERTLPLLRLLADAATALELRYPACAEREALLTLTALASALAMNFTLRGSYECRRRKGRGV